MEPLKIYEISEKYVNYLLPFAPHLFQNKQPGQQNTGKYIGVVLQVNGMDYFAPLSSFKPKHHKMKEGLDFIKIKDYAVINLNNMFPAPKGTYQYVDFSQERNLKYQSLLMAEYRYIKSIQERIRKNAQTLYNHKQAHGDNTPLSKRCNDFSLLEEACKKYRRK